MEALFFAFQCGNVSIDKGDLLSSTKGRVNRQTKALQNSNGQPTNENKLN